MQLDTGEVDGVPTLSAKEGVVPGLLRAHLLFGVGRCDETMAVSGVNHLVEHLTLQSMGTKPYFWNGSVTSTATAFMVMGDPEQVVEFLGDVTRKLRDLPMERLTDEVRVLRVESERRDPSQLGLDLSIRFGPSGAGLLGWPEYGLLRLEAEEVLQWAQTWFTAANAMLWTSGPVPPSLNLGNLPRGKPVTREISPHLFASARTLVGVDTRTVSLSMMSNDEFRRPHLACGSTARL